jgi:hypothetical protein
MLAAASFEFYFNREKTFCNQGKLGGIIRELFFLFCLGTLWKATRLYISSSMVMTDGFCHHHYQHQYSLSHYAGKRNTIAISETVHHRHKRIMADMVMD